MHKVNQFTKKLLLVLYPLFIPSFFLLALYVRNINETNPKEIVIPFIAAMGFSSLVMVVLFLCYQDFRKATILATVFLIFFFGYRYFHTLINLNSKMLVGGILISSYKEFILSLFGVIIFSLAGYFINKLNPYLDNIALALSILSLSLVVAPLTRVTVTKVMGAGEIIQPSVKDIVSTKKPSVLPNIYYIILDRYPSQKNLQETFGFDNSEFINWLSEQGFYVASESMANYPFTSWSLPSSFNMDYLDGLTQKINKKTADRGFLFKIYKKNRIWQFLKMQGYQFIYSGSWWAPTAYNGYADKNIICNQLRGFPRQFLYSTWAYTPLERLGIVDDFRKIHYKTALCQFEKIKKTAVTDDPSLVVAHINMPHDPFVFDANGRVFSEEEERQRSWSTNYTEQVIFTNKKAKELIETLLKNSKTPPIIVVQGDEAIRTTDYSTKQAKEKELRILNAYYLPNGGNSLLYPDISPVNSFRIIFNYYFGTNLPLLPDRHYWVDENHPYNFYPENDLGT